MLFAVVLYVCGVEKVRGFGEWWMLACGPAIVVLHVCVAGGIDVFCFLGCCFVLCVTIGLFCRTLARHCDVCGLDVPFCCGVVGLGVLVAFGVLLC